MKAASSALTAGLALALVVGGLTDRVVLLLATVLVQALFAAVWLTTLAAAGSAQGRVLVAGAALAADVVVLATDETRPMAHVPPVVALALVAAFAQQLVRRDGRAALTASLSAVVTGSLVAALGSAWLAVDASQDGTVLLLVGVVAAASVGLVHAGPAAIPRSASDGVAVVAALGAAAVAVAASDVGPAPALAVALGAAVAARLGVLTAHRVTAPHAVLPAALPLLLAAPVVYLLGRLLVG